MTSDERTQADRTAVEAALERAQIKRFVAMDWTVDASRNALFNAFVTAFDDRAILAAEVVRLTAALATAELMRDAWMAEYNRLQLSRLVMVSSSGSTSREPQP